MPQLGSAGSVLLFDVFCATDLVIGYKSGTLYNCTMASYSSLERSSALLHFGDSYTRYTYNCYCLFITCQVSLMRLIFIVSFISVYDFHLPSFINAVNLDKDYSKYAKSFRCLL